MANADQITVAASGKISVAPLGSTLPTTPTGALGTGFVDLGYVTEDGVTFTAEATVEDIAAWQSATPVRRVTTARNLTVSWTGLEWSKDSFALAFGGGTWTEPSAGVFKYEPPADTAALSEHILVIDANDGDKNYRWIVKKGNVSDAVETNLVRTGAAVLPVTFAAMTPDGDDTAWEFYTDDPAFEIPGP